METSQGTEDGLRRDLSGRQIGMIALGGAIGTGLFLGSGLAIDHAGPAVLIDYAAGALVALALAYALAEMVVVHPEAGGFGPISQRYLGGLASFVQRWLYWAAQVVNLGSEVVAAGIYVKFWYPALPLWLPVVAFAVVMLAVNAAAVRFFGEFEYWFAMVKVVTIVVFVLLGLTYLVVGLPGHPAIGFSVLTQDGLVPRGAGAVWMALTAVTFSYLGTEAVAMTAAESRDPRRDVPRAARNMVLRLGLFYVLAVFVLVSILPWHSVSGGGVEQSPFVRLFALAGIPAAAGIMNFVVLTAALSAMNTNLYVTSRMTLSLARDGYLPRWFAGIGRGGAPRRALLLSAAGLALATGVSATSPDAAFPVLLAMALFGAGLTWILIFASQLAFRRRRKAEGLAPSPVQLPGAPVTTVLAMAFLAVVLVTLLFDPDYWIAWLAGVPFTAALCLAYALVRRRSG